MDIVRRHCRFLRESQWWSAADLRDYQWRHIKRVYAHVLRHVPLYQDLYEGRSSHLNNWDEFLDLPVLTKDRLMESDGGCHSQRLPPGHHALPVIHTSGSTGQKMEVHPTSVTEQFRAALSIREFEWHGVRPEGSAMVIRALITPDEPNYEALMEGVRAPSWASGYVAGLVNTGPGYFMDVGADVQRQVKFLDAVRPEYLMSNASNLVEMAELWTEDRRSRSRLKLIRTLAETLYDDYRKRIEEAFGVPVYDAYSSAELNSIASECAGCEGLHVQDENVLLEVLREDGTPCEPGEVGRAVLTGLHHYGTPFIRYELGDMVESAEPCSCGRGLALLRHVHGRTFTMIQRPNGSPVLSSALFHVLNELRGLRGVQVRQHGPERFEALVVCSGADAADLSKKIVQAFRGVLWPEVEVEVRVVEALQRSAGGKLERFVRL